LSNRADVRTEGSLHHGPVPEAYSSNFAFMVMLALSTLDTGHPVLAFSAAFWKVAWSALGTRPTTSR